MAETVKRRVAAARLAVAFVAAGAIAGATAWASAGTPPEARESAAYVKGKLDSSDIKNGSLLVQDFKAGEILSGDAFVKYKRSIAEFKRDIASDSATIKGELGDVKLQIGDIKGELGGYVKAGDADARYVKLSDPVVRGSGSVLSDSKLVTAVGTHVPLLAVPGLLKVEAENGKPRLFYVVNESGVALAHTTCGEGGFGNSAGVVQPGKSFSCLLDTETTTVQMFTQTSDPTVATLTVSALSTGQGENAQYTTQILVGL